MSAAKNGGTAFPFTRRDSRSDQIDDQFEGMSLRDYFAARAPITLADAMIASGFDDRSIGVLAAARRKEVFERLAMLRGEYAEAMIAERAK